MEDQRKENEEEWADAGHLFYEPEKWCIYRVPNKLRNVNAAAYTPQLVSIGPFHHGKPELKDMEIHKRVYCQIFCERSSKSKDELKRFIKDREVSILSCYADTTIDQCDDFAEVILVDACFIIELFLMNPEQLENYYHILRSPWLRKAIGQDLILFENQLPYFLLQELYDFAMPTGFHPRNVLLKAQEQAHSRHTGMFSRLQQCYCLPGCYRAPPRDDIIDIDVEPAETVHPFLKLTCEFFDYYSNGKTVKNRVDPKHFTDLVRHFLCPEEEMTWVDNRVTPVKSIYDARKLKAAGVNFRFLKEAGFVIKGDESHDCNFSLACFTSMDLKLKQFCVKDETECVVRNVMALEQLLYPNSAYICQYFLLLDKLVDTVEDVNLLIESEVIVNKLGCNETILNIINKLCEQIMDDVSCYGGVCAQLNKHYRISFWNRNVATLQRVYFKDLWTGSSSILGLFVLIFSIIATIKSLEFS